MDEVKVTLWPDDENPDEETLRRIMAEQGLRPYSWANGPHDVYQAHKHRYHKVIYVVYGAIQFGLPEQNKTVHLEAGDRLFLPAGVIHNAVVGSEGVKCLEAHQ